MVGAVDNYNMFESSETWKTKIDPSKGEVLPGLRSKIGMEKKPYIIWYYINNQ